MRRVRLLLPLLLASTLHAQWQLQDAHTTTDLRGIDNVGHGVAWASGNHGTVLRTLDNGASWQHCATPPDAEALDFRGVQAFDKDTAIVMSSGKGDLSRLYKTTDGCQTWKLVFTNPDKDGFWDAVKFANQNLGFIAGDPVSSNHGEHKAQFVIYVTEDAVKKFKRWSSRMLQALPSEAGAFAASNSSLLVIPSEDIHGWLWLGIGGKIGPSIFRGVYLSDLVEADGHSPITDIRWERSQVPLATGSSAGTFSVAVKDHETNSTRNWIFSAYLVALGGDFTKPELSAGTAAHTSDGGQHWLAATTPPHGYRSAVAYDKPTNTWITVGPNGTDISTDDGRNWRALKPGPDDDPEADQHWNALSLPFVVGPHGRIGILRECVLKPVEPSRR